MDVNRTFLRGHAGIFGNVLDYSTFLKCIVHIDVFYQLQNMLSDKFPSILEQSQTYSEDLDAIPDYLRMEVKKPTSSSLVLYLKCVSRDNKLTLNLMEQFRGLTVCIGYFKEKGMRSTQCGKRSAPMFMLVKSVRVEEKDIDIVGTEGRVFKATCSIISNRLVSQEWDPRTQDVLFLLPLCSMLNYQRMMKAAHNIHRAPERIHQTLFGASFLRCQAQLILSTTLEKIYIA